MTRKHLPKEQGMDKLLCGNVCIVETGSVTRHCGHYVCLYVSVLGSIKEK